MSKRLLELELALQEANSLVLKLKAQAKLDRETAQEEMQAMQERLAQRMERQLEQMGQLVADKAALQDRIEAMSREREEGERMVKKEREARKVEERVKRERWEEEKRREIK